MSTHRIVATLICTVVLCDVTESQTAHNYLLTIGHILRQSIKTEGTQWKVNQLYISLEITLLKARTVAATCL